MTTTFENNSELEVIRIDYLAPNGRDKKTCLKEKCKCYNCQYALACGACSKSYCGIEQKDPDEYCEKFRLFEIYGVNIFFKDIPQLSELVKKLNAIDIARKPYGYLLAVNSRKEEAENDKSRES